MTTQDLPQLLSIEELADYLRIPRTTIYVWRSNGVGPPGIKIGRHVRFRRDDVEAWLEKRTRRGSDGA